MSNVIEKLEKEQMRLDIPKFDSGDTIKVHVKIREGDKERIQVFQGVVIKKTKGLAGARFTVRKISGGVGVERIFPLYSPIIDKIEVVSKGRVRRSKLYYLRNLRGKAARIKEKTLCIAVIPCGRSNRRSVKRDFYGLQGLTRPAGDPLPARSCLPL